MKYVIFTIGLLSVFTQFNQAQILTDFPCYTVATNNGQSNVLFEYDPSTNAWFQIGTTGTNFIGAIAIDVISDIMYATEGSGGSQGVNGALGIIDRTTGNFQKIGAPGFGNGAFGAVNLNNIDGLSFDPINQIMYATHHIEGDGPGTNDLLFQIDLSTGGFVPNAMIDGTTGFPADYAVIPEVIDGELDGGSYDVSDIAYNPYTGELYAMHRKQNNRGLISTLDPQTGEIEQVILDLQEANTGGLAFSYLGELYATTGNNSFLYIDLLAAETVLLSQIDPSGDNIGFESFDCDVSRNDLALTISLDSSTQLPIQPGDLVTCLITIYNQGDIANYDISLTSYIPADLSLADSDWINSPNGSALTTLAGPVLSGRSTNTTITLKVDDTYNGNLITAGAEITSSFNPNFVDVFGNLIPLPDADSYPNDLNDEVNVVDDEINGGGLNTNEDEDDHDIVLLNFNNDLPNVLNLTGQIDGGNYLARQTIFSNGLLKPFGAVFFKAGDDIVLQNGFCVERSTFFDAEIGGVE